MKFNEFYEKLKEKLNKIDIKISQLEADKMFVFMNMLIETNKNINLTAITDPNEIILKHFTDSLTISKYIKKNSKVIDVGTGAGFPGIPLAICREDIDVTLMDSLNKRVNFLNDIVEINHLKNVQAIHDRAENLGQKTEYREKYDAAVSRAVAPINILIEYLLPFIKVNGICICMKGPNYRDELEISKTALRKLGGEVYNIQKIEIGEGLERNLIMIKKIRKTNKEYPRNPGTPSKRPL